jgi:hypothetical protein
VKPSQDDAGEVVRGRRSYIDRRLYLPSTSGYKVH